MAKRNHVTQKKHDAKVKKQAGLFLEKGHKVKADVPGFQKPRSINGSRPDIWATNGKESTILEVETPLTVKKDKSQHSRFQKYADQSDHRYFIIKIAK